MRDKRLSFCAGFSAAVVIGGLAVALIGVPEASALEQSATEREVIKACEKRLCDIVVGKQPAGDDLNCPLSKTWAQSSIKGGIEKRKLTWSLGDARCSADLSLKRDAVLGAVTKPEAALEFPAHDVKCEVEREKEITTVNITLAPKVTFKNGAADKMWLNVKTIEAPAIVKGAIWTAAQIEDNFGLFQSEIISEINDLVQKKCPKVVTSN